MPNLRHSLTLVGLYYINLYAQEVFPEPNPDVLEQLASRDILVYSCGSLWTRYNSRTLPGDVQKR
jgi:hypothetical protein